MLGEGVAAGLRYLGVDVRVVMHAEREAYPAAVLAARMEEGSLHAAPVWLGDLRAVPYGRFRGVVDAIIAGFPCQDLSVAGARAGLDGSRSGLFFDILDAADACGAWCLALENVAGIATATASVVDEAEGALEERAAARVLGELADRGWNAEWLTLSASDVGASHGRERWFCLAWRRLDDAGRSERWPQVGRGDDCAQGHASGRHKGAGRSGEPDPHVDDAESEDSHGPGIHPRRRGEGQGAPDACRAGDCPASTVADAEPAGRRSEAGAYAPGIGCVEEQGSARLGELGGDALGRPELVGCELADTDEFQRWREQQPGRARQCRCGPEGSLAAVADAEGDDTRGRLGLGAEAGAGTESRPLRHGEELADTSIEGLPQPECGELRGPRRRDEGRATAELRGAPFLFAPGPADPRWPAILADHSHLAPALEPSFRSVVDGLAFDMDDCRAARLKCVGNGVVPACAGFAFAELARRAGIFVMERTP
ncbi:DNA cytosine methyltransferase [Ramlibacter sp.]|uniref:DNA cytosine methyltransferase n=1 Tax=Ramlibacter sp. TaxID=1917967 RepID=UPI003D099040